MTHRFHIVDVFAERRYAGNQLAVVLDAADISHADMLAIAREFNFAETTFVSSGELASGGHPVRIFTPKEELPFAGHPTLGTAWVLRREYGTARDRDLTLNLPVGQVRVSFEEGEIHGLAWLEAPTAEFAVEIDAPVAAAALGLEVSDLAAELPVRQVKMGLSVLVVPLASAEALGRARPDLASPAMRAITERGVPPFLYLFCEEPQDPENDITARFFFDGGGGGDEDGSERSAGVLREDSATGSASACLGAYLVHNGRSGKDGLSLRVEQGHFVGRPSLIRIDADGAPQAPMVSVGGRVVEVARGELA